MYVGLYVLISDALINQQKIRKSTYIGYTFTSVIGFISRHLANHQVMLICLSDSTLFMKSGEHQAEVEKVYCYQLLVSATTII